MARVTIVKNQKIFPALVPLRLTHRASGVPDQVRPTVRVPHSRRQQLFRGVPGRREVLLVETFDLRRRVQNRPARGASISLQLLEWPVSS